MIQAANHIGPASRELWVDPELLRIVHENSPESRGVPVPHHERDAAQGNRIVVRQNNANFTATMSDGTTYFSRLTASGDCVDDRDRCRDIIASSPSSNNSSGTTHVSSGTDCTGKRKR